MEPGDVCRGNRRRTGDRGQPVFEPSASWLAPAEEFPERMEGIAAWLTGHSFPGAFLAPFLARQKSELPVAA
jgi:hypothetical protein